MFDLRDPGGAVGGLVADQPEFVFGLEAGVEVFDVTFLDRVTLAKDHRLDSPAVFTSSSRSRLSGAMDCGNSASNVAGVIDDADSCAWRNNATAIWLSGADSSTATRSRLECSVKECDRW